MNRCSYYVQGEVPEVQPYGSPPATRPLIVLCGEDAPFMVDGCSYCYSHALCARQGKVSEALDMSHVPQNASPRKAAQMQLRSNRSYD